MVVLVSIQAGDVLEKSSENSRKSFEGNTCVQSGWPILFYVYSGEGKRFVVETGVVL